MLGDNKGDACDEDDDNDGVNDVDDCSPKNFDVYPGAPEKCDGADNNCNTQVDENFSNVDGDALADCIDPDIDNDGELNETDCDDFAPKVNHFMEETCNGIDDNCKNGADEEGAGSCTTFYRDADGDTYGTDENKCLCQPTGEFTATQKGDCSDGNGQVNPGAKERCANGLDDNCNGSQNDENAVNCQYFFLDEDGDGYGVNLSKCFCSADGNYAAHQSGDCNDQNKQVNPGQQEVCDNGVDDNCNGSTNDENALGAIPFYNDKDFDHYGVTTDFKRLCSAEGLYAALQGGDCDDTNPFVHPGAVEMCDGKTDEDCDNLIDEEGADQCENYYYDNDFDNFGVTSSVKCLCAPAGSYTTKASGDCNDYNPAIYPNAPETCNAADDNCNNLKDDAGVKQLCGEYDDAHALGSCTTAGLCKLDCTTGWVDVDLVFYNGCECQEDSYENAGGDSCTGAIDLGELSDAGAGGEAFAVGNILSLGDTDWYRVRAVDSPDIGDNACDRFAFNAELIENPGMAFRITVFMGNDAAVNCAGTGQVCQSDTRYEWYGDFKQPTSDGRQIGECPCSSSVVALPNTTRDESGGVGGVPDGVVDGYDTDRPGGKSAEPDGTINVGTSGANQCINDTRYFVVGVSRDPNVALSCAGYKLWLSNGKIIHH